MQWSVATALRSPRVFGKPGSRRLLRLTPRYLWLLAALVLLLGGCVPYSEHPLTAPDPVRTDQALFGTWYWVESNEQGYVHIGTEEESGRMWILMVTMKADGELELSRLAGHVSQIGEHRYLNLKWLGPDSDSTDWLTLSYRLEGNALQVAVMSGNPVEEAIVQGRLAGEISRKGWFRSVRVSAAPGDWAGFVAAHYDQLFPEFNELSRLVLAPK